MLTPSIITKVSLAGSALLAQPVGYRTRSTLFSWLPSGRVRPGCQLVMGIPWWTMVNGCHENQPVAEHNPPGFHHEDLNPSSRRICANNHGYHHGWGTTNSGKNSDFPHRSLYALTVKGYHHDSSQFKMIDQSLAGIHSAMSGTSRSCRY